MSHDTPHLMGDRAATGFLRAFSPAGLMMPVSMWMTVSGTPNASAASASGVAAPTASPKVDAATATRARGPAGLDRKPPWCGEMKAPAHQRREERVQGAFSQGLGQTYCAPP